MNVRKFLLKLVKKVGEVEEMWYLWGKKKNMKVYITKTGNACLAENRKNAIEFLGTKLTPIPESDFDRKVYYLDRDKYEPGMGVLEATIEEVVKICMIDGRPRMFMRKLRVSDDITKELNKRGKIVYKG